MDKLYFCTTIKGFSSHKEIMGCFLVQRLENIGSIFENDNITLLAQYRYIWTTTFFELNRNIHYQKEK